MANYCHLSYEDRKNIEDGLNENKSINQIGKEINRSHSSILREIDRNKIYFKPKQYGTLKIITMIEMFHVLDLQNRLMFVMVVILEVVVEKRDILTMLEKQMILIEKLKVKLEKVLI